MERSHPLNDLMSTTMEKIRDMVDANTIVGEPIPAGEGVTLIPVSRLAFGFASGGSEFSGKNQKPDGVSPFGGGSGAGVTISPVAFLVVKDGTVRVLPVALPAGNTLDRVVELIPDLVDKVTGFVEKKKEQSETEGF